MSYAEDLLSLARTLVELEPTRPKQATLRRAVSTAYYAVFHLLTYEGARRLIGGKQNHSPLRGTVRRAFSHVEMRQAAAGFASGNLSPKLDAVLDAGTVPQELRRFAETFVNLRADRHVADYDWNARFTRSQAADIVAATEKAFVDWEVIRKTEPARVFLVALLLLRSIRQ